MAEMSETTSGGTAKDALGGPFLYAPAPESRAVVDLAPSYGLFIDGEFTEAADGQVFKTLSPRPRKSSPRWPARAPRTWTAR